MNSLSPTTTTLGEYKLGKTIGQGAFSKVKLAVHNETGQKFAIKIIDKKAMFEKRNKNRLAQEERIKRAQKQANNPHRAILNSEYQIVPLNYQKMLQTVAANSAAKRAKEVKPLSENKIVSNLEIEVQLIMRLNHPNIIKVYQVLDSDDECLIVMDYASGGEMVEHAAKDNFLTEEEGRKYFRQLISAIDHFHLASVVHRDLKLENILLSQDKNLLITDFGLGRTFEESSDSTTDVMSTFCGTPNYAAYELVSGIPYDGVKTDIWAMGVILFIMIAGNPPFKGVTVTQVYNNIKQLNYRPPRHFSSLLVDLIDKILVKEPDRRIDMEGLRRHPWVNMDCDGPPPRIIPQFGRKVDISERVSGISFDKTYTVININNLDSSIPSPGKIQPSPLTRAPMPINIRKAKHDQPNAINDALISNSAPSRIWSKGPLPTLPSKLKSTFINASSVLATSPLAQTPISSDSKNCTDSSNVTTDKETFISNEDKPIRNETLLEPSKLIHQPSIEMKDLEEWHQTHRPPLSIRTMQVSFRNGTKTAKDPVIIFQDLHRALLVLKEQLPGVLEFKRIPDYYLFECLYEPIKEETTIVSTKIKFELEICKVWGWGIFHGIQSKRILGDALVYQDLFNQILQQLKWNH